MAFEHKEATGSIFSQKKEKETSPDFTGNMKWKGQMIRIAAWKNRKDDGTVWLSLKLSEPFGRGR